MGTPAAALIDLRSEPTTQHLLSLSPVLQTLSPPLAALHLARVRLSYNIPTDSGRNKGSWGDWWCHNCGGMRTGVGGADRGISGDGDGAESSAMANKRASQSARGKGGKKKGKRVVKKKEPEGDDEIEQVDGALIATDDVFTVVKRKPAECGQCGASFKRPKPDKSTLATFPPSRTAARTRRSTRAAQEEEKETAVESAENRMDTDGMDVDTPLVPPGAGSTPFSDDNGDVVEIAPTRTTPTLTRPLFQRVATTEGNLPTYPPPQPRSSPPAGDKGAKVKRKKKSGLAKLLAENKERSDMESKKGSWGLG